MQFYSEALLGYRLWYSSPPILASTGIGASLWEPGANQAVCRRGHRHSSPDSACECGIYAFHDLEYALTHRENMISELGPLEGPRAPLLVLGALAGCGRAEIHWNGWRAAQGQILALFAEEEQDNDAIGSYYQVPVFHDLEELASCAGARARSIEARPKQPVETEIFLRERKADPARARTLFGDEVYYAMCTHLGIIEDWS